MRAGYRHHVDRPAVGAALLVSAALLAAGGSGCRVVEGPQLGAPPEKLGYTSSLMSARLPLPDRGKARQLGYVGAGDSPDMVVITEYPGPTSRGDAERARDTYAARYTSTEYGPVEELEIDGRPAWGWTETQRIDGKVVARQYTAVVSYDDVTYSVEYSAHREPQIGEEHLRGTVESFVVPGSAPTVLIVVVGLALVALLVVWMRRMVQARS